LGADLRRRGSEDRDEALADGLLVAFGDGLESCLLVLDGSPTLGDAVFEVNNGWQTSQSKLCVMQIQGMLTGQAHCLVLFGLEDVQQGLAEAGCVFSLGGMSVVCLVLWVVDGGTFRKSSSAWRRASALVDRVAWMRVLRAAASMMGESDRIVYWIPRLCVCIVVP
jgi:hypothetical protein